MWTPADDTLKVHKSKLEVAKEQAAAARSPHHSLQCAYFCVHQHPPSSLSALRYLWCIEGQPTRRGRDSPLIGRNRGNSTRSFSFLETLSDIYTGCDLRDTMLQYGVASSLLRPSQNLPGAKSLLELSAADQHDFQSAIVILCGFSSSIPVLHRLAKQHGMLTLLWRVQVLPAE